MNILPQEKLFSISSLVQDWINEREYTTISVEKFTSDVQRTYIAGIGTIMVDDVDSPSAIIHVFKSPRLYSSEILGHIGLVYVDPEKRGTDLAEKMVKSAKNYAISIGCTNLCLGAVNKGVGKKWAAMGAKKIETHYKL